MLFNVILWLLGVLKHARDHEESRRDPGRFAILARIEGAAYIVYAGIEFVFNTGNPFGPNEGYGYGMLAFLASALSFYRARRLEEEVTALAQRLAHTPGPTAQGR